MTKNEIEMLEQGIAALEAQRATLGDSIVDTAVAPLREKLLTLRAQTQQEQQRKLVTVLFADISGFTALSETVDPEDISNLMNMLWERLDTIILAHGGHIDKHLGDGVMAIWGAETAREDDPERAIRAALDMQKMLHELHQFAESISLPPNAIQMRIGLNTGLVLLGSLGTQGEYTAMGDTVNVASRLEKAAPVGTVLISYDTYRHIRGIFNVREMPPLSIKGKSGHTQTYLVDSIRPRTFRLGTRGVEGIETHMVGRQKELSQLSTAVESASKGTPLQFMLIIGEAGMGKSRLLYEFERWLDTYPQAFWPFKARADQQRQEQALALARDLFFYRFEIQENDSQMEARQKLESGIVSLIGEPGIEEAHFIGQMLGFDYSRSPYIEPLRGDFRQLRARAFDAVIRIFSALAEQHPVVILVEDLHWTDESSLNLLAYFLEQCRQLPVVVVATARTSFFERFPNWIESFALHTPLRLQPLSLHESRTLALEILQKVRDIPSILQETIVEHADGNPFYLEELVKMLIENGSILKSDTEWKVDLHSLKTFQVPATLTGVLQARLDRLNVPERTLLQRASVVGRIFWDEALAYLSEYEDANLPESLQVLCNKELVFNRTQSSFAGAREYLFKHALLRDVTYEQVLKTQRRIYHHQSALWLIEKSHDRANEYAGVIAEHFDHAGDLEQAIEWYMRAGRAAADTFVYEAALDAYQRVIELSQDYPGSWFVIEAHEQLANVLYQLVRSQEAIQNYHAMRKAAIQKDDIQAQLRALHGLALVYELKGDYEAVIGVAETAEELLQNSEQPDQAELAQAFLEKARGLYYQGKYAEAKISAERGLSAALTCDAPVQTARLYNIAGMVLTAEGKYEQAIANKIQSLERWRAIGSRQYEAAMLNNIGENYRVMGENEQAIQFYEQSLEIARQVRDTGQVIVCLSNLGGVHLAMDNFDQAAQILEQSLRLSKESVFTEAETLTFLAEAYLGQGRLPDAVKTIRDALQKSEAQQNSFQGNIWRVLAKVSATIGEPVQISESRQYSARESFQLGLQIKQTNGVIRDQAIILWDWARYELIQGEYEKGHKMLNESRNILKKLGLQRLLDKLNDEFPPD